MTWLLMSMYLCVGYMLTMTMVAVVVAAVEEVQVQVQVEVEVEVEVEVRVEMEVEAEVEVEVEVEVRVVESAMRQLHLPARSTTECASYDTCSPHLRQSKKTESCKEKKNVGHRVRLALSHATHMQAECSSCSGCSTPPCSSLPTAKRRNLSAGGEQRQNGCHLQQQQLLQQQLGNNRTHERGMGAQSVRAAMAALTSDTVPF
jgi:hypothetical protein